MKNFYNYKKTCDEHNIRYQVVNYDKDVVGISIPQKLNCGAIVNPIVVFDRDIRVEIYVLDYAHIDNDRRNMVIEYVNDLNSKYEVPKFYIDKHNDFMVFQLLFTSEDFDVNFIDDCLINMFNILNDNYSKIMKILWSN